jgi:hypothetical protein
VICSARPYGSAGPTAQASLGRAGAGRRGPASST